ncbi:MAG: YihY/virulence factor BrkB family protein [Leptospirales bacterium]|nr:YihY/virulence factor BrkB family protein [Leptospirales bacterium]
MEAENKTRKLPSLKHLLNRYTLKKIFFIDIISKAARGEQSFGKYPDKIINTVKLFIIATRKFLEDQCLTNAASITYAIIVSLIPSLAVVLTASSFFKGKDARKDELFRAVSSFMAEHNITLNVDPIFAAISSLIENAGKIGGISAVIMIFTATAMLRTLETSLNRIWKVQRQRGLMVRIGYYWTALTLGPIIFICAATVATSLSSAFSSPAYTSAAAYDDKVWVAGSKASILYSQPDKVSFRNIDADAIDFDNQQVYVYQSTEGTFFPSENIEYEYSKTVFSDIQFIDAEGWAVGNQGIILYTENGGKNWKLRKWGNISFNSIYMADKKNGFAAANNGILLSTDDGGKSWRTLKFGDIMLDFTSIKMKNNIGIVTVSNGTIFKTSDGGRTWENARLSNVILKRRLSLNNSFFIDNDIWLLGSNGMVFTSRDGGQSWQTTTIRNFDFTDAFFFNRNEGIITASKGRIFITSDGGATWRADNLPTPRTNKLFEKDGNLWALGDKGLAMISKDKGVTWSGVKSSDFIGFVINFLTPFVFIWVLFFLCFTMLPNTKVPMKEAAIGSSFTSAVWVIFILLFIVYVKSFAKGTLAIYGALAVIPLFLLLIYASAIIVLYGAEVAYTLMHPEIYANIYHNVSDRREIHIYYGVSIIHHIYQKFEKGLGGSEFKELSKLCTYNSEEVDFFLKKFLDDKLILHDHDMGYIPTNSSRNIALSDIIDSIHNISINIPKGVRKSNLKSYMEKLLSKMEEDRKSIVGQATLADLMK